ncbi:MAG: [protein-PII] uridylyltransferase [Thermodesulfobacteriota bacterium]|nr:[protein-PII] uridylyltransferase [Thermodesulfobacteriota bacterium]
MTQTQTAKTITAPDMLSPAMKRLCKDRDRAIAAFLDKGRIKPFLSRHTAILDQYFIDSFEKSMVGPKMQFHKKPYAMIALGGYGRQEQCIHSDIDILVLFKKQVPPESEALIREVLYPLWDMGFEVGHATRTLKECMSLAAEETDVLTALLDARFLCGMSTLYGELRERLDKYLAGKRARSLCKKLVLLNQERHDRFGDSSYLLEPNLKEGCGGLRDYHTILWLARIQHKLMQTRDLEYLGILSHDEYHRLEKALSFVWKTRNHLHHLTRRKYDQLYFEHQVNIAAALGFKGVKGQLPVERFLGKLHAEMEYIKQMNMAVLLEMGVSGRSFTVIRKPAIRNTDVPGLYVDRNLLGFVSPEHILNEPNLLIRIFEESARLKLPLSAEARRLVKEFAHLINKSFRRDPANLQIFERILVTPTPTYNVLNEMLNTGFLERFIPKIKTISDRIQYDGYHLYPIDRHSLRTVKTLKDFSAKENADDLTRKLFKEIGKQKNLLLWAALLHDIGKGEAGHGHAESGAKIATRILTDFGYTTEKIDTVAFLIKEHLFLIKTATRRDLNDEETAIFCARRIKTEQSLKMLYLLTVADSMATGPKAWNDWTAELLRDLFFKILKILEKGELATIQAVTSVKNKQQAVLDGAASEYEKSELAGHLKILSPRYLLYTPDHAIIEHMRLYRQLNDKAFTWDIQKNADSQTRTVTVCAPDRPGLFSKIAGILALNGLNIMGAEIFTWKNNIALDVFVVSPPADLLYEDDRWRKTGDDLQAALGSRLNITEELDANKSSRSRQTPYATRPHRITMDNDASSFFTIIEVITYDRPGLLFDITDVLFRHQLDVKLAKIATKVDQVVDVFYIRDVEGQKIENADLMEKVRTGIEAVLEKTSAEQ